jgi:hypothetical protein
LVELIAGTEVWAEALPVALIERIDLRSLNGEACVGGEGRTEDGHVLVAVVEGTLVVVADAVVDVEFRAQLPGIAGVEEPGVDEDLTLWVSNS